MKNTFAVSNIGWNRHDDPAILDLLSRYHVSGIELAPSKVWSDLETVTEKDAEEYRESFDIVTSRAVARLTILLELCTPLLKVAGTMVALKGKGAKEELTSASKALDVLSLEYIETKEVEVYGAKHQNMYFKKNKKTDEKYPRHYGQIKKKPLGE